MSNWSIIIQEISNLFNYLNTYLYQLLNSVVTLLDIFITSLSNVLSALTNSPFLQMINLFLTKIPTIYLSFILVSFSFTIIVSFLRKV